MRYIAVCAGGGWQSRDEGAEASEVMVGVTARSWNVRGAVVGWLLAVLVSSSGADTLSGVRMRREIAMPADGERSFSAVITALAMQPGGHLIAVAGDDHVIRIWDRDSGELVVRLVGHHDWIRGVAFSPDGSRLVSSGNDRQVLLWDVAHARLEAVLAVHDHAIDAVAFAHSGQWVATAGFEDKLCILDLTGNTAKRVLHGPCRDIRAIAISSDDRHVAAAGRDGIVRVWDVRTEQLVREVAAHTQRVRALTFSQGDSQLISGGEDRVVRSGIGKRTIRVRPCLDNRPKSWRGDVRSPRACDGRERQRDSLVGSGHPPGTDTIDRAHRFGGRVGLPGWDPASGGFDTYLRLWQVPELIDEGYVPPNGYGSGGRDSQVSTQQGRRRIVGWFSNLFSSAPRRAARQATSVAAVQTGTTWRCAIEPMEARCMLTANPIWLGGWSTLKRTTGTIPRATISKSPSPAAHPEPNSLD